MCKGLIWAQAQSWAASITWLYARWRWAQLAKAKLKILVNYRRTLEWVEVLDLRPWAHLIVTIRMARQVKLMGCPDQTRTGFGKKRGASHLIYQLKLSLR